MVTRATLDKQWAASGHTGVRHCHECGKHLGSASGTITFATLVNPIGQEVRAHFACVKFLKFAGYKEKGE